MKKLISVLLCISLVLAFVGCSKGTDDSTKTTEKTDKVEESTVIETILNPTEYILYQNIFSNNQTADYAGKETTKEGIFTILYDEFNSTTRYYVWGYNDNTKCCDWQWEIVPTDVSNLPSAGSSISVTGTYAESENALDGFWIENASITVNSVHKGYDVDVDMTTMGGTLERVQVINLQQYPDKFEGKTVVGYGRIESTNTFQHPYYNDCFSQKFSSSDDVLAIGTVAIVSGTYVNGVIDNASINATTDF